jgi:DNA-binding IclR family transcriptional regulator
MSDVLDLPASSIHHILSTLRLHNYVRQNADTKRYSLGFRFLEISGRILDNLDVRTVAADHLRKLSKATEQTVHLAVLNGGKVVYIDKIGAQSGLSLVTHIGFATDPHAAAGGKVLLSELTENEVRRIYQDRALVAHGKNTITNLEDLLGELDRVRQQGYAIDDEEYYEGVRCVSAPIRAGGRIVAAISITGSVFTMTMERIHTEFREMVIETAAGVSSELKW